MKMSQYKKNLETKYKEVLTHYESEWQALSDKKRWQTDQKRELEPVMTKVVSRNKLTKNASHQNTKQESKP